MSALLEAIELRIKDPEAFTEMKMGEDMPQLMARAVATLFETAEPDEDSILRKIDLPAELVSAAVALRATAEVSLKVQSEDGQRAANRLGFLANIVEDVSHLIENPATMLEVLREDRDRWQMSAQFSGQSLALTEAALGTSQQAVTALAEGQDKLVKLLERVARHFANRPLSYDMTQQPAVSKTADDAAMRIHEVVHLGPFTYRAAVEIQRALDADIPDVLPEIHAVLNQLTVIETDPGGRLTVAQQPVTAAENVQIVTPLPEICADCGGPNDRPGESVYCTTCIPF